MLTRTIRYFKNFSFSYDLNSKWKIIFFQFLLVFPPKYFYPQRKIEIPFEANDARSK